MVGGEPARARVPRADSRGGRVAREPAGFHRVGDSTTRQGIDHVTGVARHHHSVGIGLLDRRMHDDAADGIAGADAPGEPACDPIIEVLPRVAAVRFQRHDAKSHVRDADALRENPRISAWRDSPTELQVDRIRIDVDVLEHVLRA